MQISQRSPQRRAAQAQVQAAPWCASARGRYRALSHRRASRFFKVDAPEAKKFHCRRAAITENILEKVAETSPPRTCLPLDFTCARSHP